MNFRSVPIEGRDQIGKGDVTQHLMQEFTKREINIHKISFPVYSTPFGGIVRKTLENGFVGIPELKDICGTPRELELKMAGYALNRLEALDSVLRRFNEKEEYFLLDRSPYSQALTIAYGLGGVGSIKKEEVADLVEWGMDFEKLFINTFNATECVLHLKADYGKTGWRKTREDGDLYEVKEIQEVADVVYEEIASFVGKGWNCVYTKKNGEWRDRRDIYREVNGIIDRLGYKSSHPCARPIFDILEIAQDVYNTDVSNLESYQRYFMNIEIDDNERNRETYRLAYEIAGDIIKNCKYVKFHDAEVMDSVREILGLYPEMFILLDYYWGENFMNKLKEGIYG